MAEPEMITVLVTVKASQKTFLARVPADSTLTQLGAIAIRLYGKLYPNEVYKLQVCRRQATKR